MTFTVYVNPGNNYAKRVEVFEDFQPEQCLGLKDDRLLFRKACEAAEAFARGIAKKPGEADDDADYRRLLLATEFRNQWFREHLAAEAAA